MKSSITIKVPTRIRSVLADLLLQGAAQNVVKARSCELAAAREMYEARAAALEELRQQVMSNFDCDDRNFNAAEQGPDYAKVTPFNRHSEGEP